METNDFIDLLHYKIGYRIYSLLGYKNHSNIILYGKEGSGKSLLIKTTIKDIYSGLPTHQKNDFFSFTLHNNYYLFNCFCIKGQKKISNAYYNRRKCRNRRNDKNIN